MIYLSLRRETLGSISVITWMLQAGPTVCRVRYTGGVFTNFYIADCDINWTNRVVNVSFITHSQTVI
jgi:hypothetical protein